MKEFVPFNTGRQSGRTTWMVKQLCDAVEEGQPYSIVFGKDNAQVSHHLIPKVIDELENRGLQVIVKSKQKIEVEGSEINFFVRSNHILDLTAKNMATSMIIR